MRVYLEGIGLLGPGLRGWHASLPVLAGAEDYVAAPVAVAGSELLPAAERRRAGLAVKLALAVGQEAFAHAGRDPALTATVFSSSGGDGDNIHAICETLAGAEREISPTRFHNSVHNAPAGYWSIATGARAASTSLSGHDASFAAGLLDAAVQVAADGAAVALIAHDQPYLEPLKALRPIAAPFAVALVLAPAPGAHTLAVLDVEFAAGPGQGARMDAPGLEALRAGVPAARCLPLLAALARGLSPRAALAALERGGAALELQYLARNHLRVALAPWS
jgi:hypothetical protein